jgi:hypothetical protein
MRRHGNGCDEDRHILPAAPLELHSNISRFALTCLAVYYIAPHLILQPPSRPFPSDPPKGTIEKYHRLMILPLFPPKHEPRRPDYSLMTRPAESFPSRHHLTCCVSSLVTSRIRSDMSATCQQNRDRPRPDSTGHFNVLRTH